MKIGAHFKLHPTSEIVYQVTEYKDHHYIGEPVNAKCSNVEVRYNADVYIVNRQSGKAQNVAPGRHQSA